MFNLVERGQQWILASKKIRTCHNQEGLDPRSQKPALTCQEIATICAFLTNQTTTLEQKSLPWLDIQDLVSVKNQIECPKIVQRACKRDKNIIAIVLEVKKELTNKQAKICLAFCNKQLGTRDKPSQKPYSKNQKDMVFCNKFYFRIGS